MRTTAYFLTDFGSWRQIVFDFEQSQQTHRPELTSPKVQK